jgi:hypothetical protein
MLLRLPDRHLVDAFNALLRCASAAGSLAIALATPDVSQQACFASPWMTCLCSFLAAFGARVWRDHPESSTPLGVTRRLHRCASRWYILIDVVGKSASYEMAQVVHCSEHVGGVFVEQAVEQPSRGRWMWILLEGWTTARYDVVKGLTAGAGPGRCGKVSIISSPFSGLCNTGKFLSMEADIERQHGA